MSSANPMPSGETCLSSPTINTFSGSSEGWYGKIDENDQHLKRNFNLAAAGQSEEFNPAIEGT